MVVLPWCAISMYKWCIFPCHCLYLWIYSFIYLLFIQKIQIRKCINRWFRRIDKNTFSLFAKKRNMWSCRVALHDDSEVAHILQHLINLKHKIMFLSTRRSSDHNHVQIYQWSRFVWPDIDVHKSQLVISSVNHTQQHSKSVHTANNCEIYFTIFFSINQQPDEEYLMLHYILTYAIIVWLKISTNIF